MLDKLPRVAIESFTGVSNVSIIADIPVGTTVLDLGCGAGLDSLIAALRTGPDGKVIGVDFSESMISRARQAFKMSGFDNGEFRIADAENLPVEDNSIDVALVNGIFNLSPDRGAVFLHLARVLKDDGSVYAAELILNGSEPQSTQCDLTNWFA